MRAATPSWRHAKRRGAITKTGLMLGLGETCDEVRQVLRETRDIGVDILTLGQYLRPSRQHLPVARYVTPEEFARPEGRRRDALGFPHVESGPMVRSSYHADGQRDIVRALRAAALIDAARANRDAGSIVQAPDRGIERRAT